MNRQKIPTASHPRIVERYRNGESPRQIAATFGVWCCTIRAIVLKAGVRTRPPGPASPGRGYAWLPHCRRFVAYTAHPGRRRIGYFRTEAEAAEAVAQARGQP